LNLYHKTFILGGVTSKEKYIYIITQNLWKILPNSQNEILRYYNVSDIMMLSRQPRIH
jgi:hypothetical protein